MTNISWETGPFYSERDRVFLEAAFDVLDREEGNEITRISDLGVLQAREQGIEVASDLVLDTACRAYVTVRKIKSEADSLTPESLS